MMSAAFAHAPFGAIRSGLTGWKPSGILAATVSRPWSCGQFQLPSSQASADTSLLRQSSRSPKTSFEGWGNGGLGSQVGATCGGFASASGNYFRIVDRSVKNWELDIGMVAGSYNNSNCCP